jgi:AcrR family transcriptional regulator
MSTKDIAKRAEVTEGSLFRLFGSKQTLFKEAIDHVIPECFDPSFRKPSDEMMRFVLFALLESPAPMRRKINRAVSSLKKRERAKLAEQFAEYWLRGILK